MQQPQGFVAPIEVPNEIKPEEGLDLGVEGGVAGGVEGGVPGGVVGGVVGGLPTEAPPPPAKVVRIGGQITEPKLIRNVEPVYPDLAVQSRVSALVILEAEVDTRGHVKAVKVLRGHPLFDEAAHGGREAVALPAAAPERRADRLHPHRDGQLQPAAEVGRPAGPTRPVGSPLGAGSGGPFVSGGAASQASPRRCAGTWRAVARRPAAMTAVMARRRY